MQIKMGIVGVPNTIITATMTDLDKDMTNTQRMRHNDHPLDREGGTMKRVGFNQARRRFAKQDATEVCYFPVEG